MKRVCTLTVSLFTELEITACSMLGVIPSLHAFQVVLISLKEHVSAGVLAFHIPNNLPSSGHLRPYTTSMDLCYDILMSGCDHQIITNSVQESTSSVLSVATSSSTGATSQTMSKQRQHHSMLQEAFALECC